MLAVVATASLAACDPANDLKVGTIGFVSGFAGGVTSDEPRATLVGRDVLAAGGTAADAAVAMGLTLAVTLPSSAGLAGGGVCVVNHVDSKTVEVLDFLPPPGPDGVTGVPAMPRGLFALHAKYGRLRWEEVVSPAENLARFGNPVSRAFARELVAGAPYIQPSPEVGRVLAGPDGRPLGEGAVMTQLDLAALLGRLRQRGPADWYGGPLGRDWAEAARRAGARVTVEDLRGWLPQWRQPAAIAVGNDELSTPPQGMAGHAVAELWRTDAASTLPAERQGGPLGATGFVVADRDGNAVSCALTMNGAFGVGRMVPGFGAFLPGAPQQAGDSLLPLAAALIINRNVDEFRFGVAGGGGGAPENAVRVAAAAVAEDRSLSEALSAVAGQPSGQALVDALHCPKGLPPFPGSCSIGSDPRGAGYALLIGDAGG